MSYALCFDFPEHGDPFFAAILNDGLGLTESLERAVKFTDWDAAERTLLNGFGPITREFGVVVEVDRVAS